MCEYRSNAEMSCILESLTFESCNALTYMTLKSLFKTSALKVFAFKVNYFGDFDNILLAYKEFAFFFFGGYNSAQYSRLESFSHCWQWLRQWRKRWRYGLHKRTITRYLYMEWIVALYWWYFPESFRNDIGMLDDFVNMDFYSMNEEVSEWVFLETIIALLAIKIDTYMWYVTRIVCFIEFVI